MYTATILLLGIIPPALMFLFGSAAHRGSLHPFTVLGWALLIGYTLKSIYLAFAVNYNLPFRTDNFSRDIVTLGQVAICIGLVSFMAGFMLVARGHPGATVRATPTYKVSQPAEFIYHLVFALSAILMIIYFYQMDFLNQIINLQFQAKKWFVDDLGERNALGFLIIGADFIVVFFLYYVTCAKQLTWNNRYVLGILFISLCFLLASRRNGVLVIIITFMMVIGARGVIASASLNLRRLLIIGGTLLTVAFVGLIRQGGEEGVAAQDLSVSSALTVTAEQMFEGAYFLDPAKTAAIIDQTKRRNLYMGGDSLIAVIYTPIPRVLWPEKPDIRVGPYVAQQVLRIGNRSGVPPGAIGELYLNFGWSGIVVGMLLLGAGTSMLYNLYLGNRDDRLARPIYALLLFSIMIFFTGDFASSFLNFVRYIAAGLVCYFYWRSIIARNQILQSAKADRIPAAPGFQFQKS